MSKDGGSIRPSIDLLAAEASLSPRTVHKGLAELRDAGFLIVERQGGGRHRPTLYRAIIPPKTLHDVHPFAAKRLHVVRGNDAETLHIRSENPALGAEEDVQEDVTNVEPPLTPPSRGGRRKRDSSSEWEGIEAYDRA